MHSEFSLTMLQEGEKRRESEKERKRDTERVMVGKRDGTNGEINLLSGEITCSNPLSSSVSLEKKNRWSHFTERSQERICDKCWDWILNKPEYISSTNAKCSSPEQEMEETNNLQLFARSNFACHLCSTHLELGRVNAEKFCNGCIVKLKIFCDLNQGSNLEARLLRMLFQMLPT